MASSSKIDKGGSVPCLKTLQLIAIVEKRKFSRAGACTTKLITVVIYRFL
jgi:hypothetical protein